MRKTLAMAKESDPAPAVVNSPLLDKKELAATLNIGVRTIERLATDPREDFPRGVRIGRQLRWRREAVEAWLSRREAEANAI